MNTISKICIYSGGFQPFGPHHFEAYRWLVSRFGENDVYVCTSNHITNERPLNFQEKKSIILKYQIPTEKIILVKNPYRADELVSKFNPNTTSVIFAYGEKDYGRIQFTKKDGTQSYLRPYTGIKTLRPISECGHVVQVPNIKIGGKDISGTWLRKNLPVCSVQEFENIMGWYDANIHQLMKNKFQENIHELYNSIIQKPQFQKKFTQPTMEDFKEVFRFTRNQSRHIMHPHEDPDLTFNDVNDMIIDLVNGGISSTLKVDGRNLKMTYKNGEYRSARNKGTTVNPMSLLDIDTHFKGRGSLHALFVKAHADMEEFLNTVSKIDWKDGRVFVNFEILYAPEPSTIPNKKSQLCIHGLIEYNEKGIEVSKYDFPEFSPYQSSYYEVLRTPTITLNPITNQNVKYDLCDRLNEIRLDCRLNWSDPIGMISSLSKRTDLEMLILHLGNLVIQNNCKQDDSVVNNLIFKLSEVEEQIEHETDSKILDQYEAYSTKLNSLGRLRSINPIEGYVFKWKNGSTYKVTGSFAPLNRILAIYRYKK